MNFIITLLILIISETTYSLRAFPIGGFVSMAEKEDSELKIKKERVLENKSFIRQFIVFLNGILFNFILAIIVFFISGLLYGRPISEPVIQNVIEGKPAYDSGLEEGDRILELNGTEINTWDDFVLEASAKKLKDKYVFKFISNSNRPMFSISFNTDRSKYRPFAFAFVTFLSNLKKVTEEYHQIEIEEYMIKSLKKRD